MRLAGRNRFAWIVAALALTTAARATAASSPTPTVPCATVSECFAEMVRAQGAVSSVKARFKQTKRIALLREPLVSTGTFVFQRPDRVRWQVVSPEPMVIEINGEHIRAGDDAEHLSAIDAGGATSVFRDLAGVFTGAGTYASDRFRVTQGPGGPYSFVVTPRAAALARVIASLEIDADPSSRWPRRAVIHEPDGDTTEVELSDTVVNAPIDPGLFE